MTDIEIVAEPDPPSIEAVFRSFRGTFAFDIGANAGQSARSLATRFTHVLSCEPASESFPLLEEVAEEFPNVLALPVAVAAETGPLTLTVQANHIARGQLTAYREEVEDGHAWGEVVGHRVVDAVTLDDLAAKHGAPDFVKIDVEGSEVAVIQGGLETLQATTPRLYIEVHNAELGEEIHDLLAPFYGHQLERLSHPNYRPDEWGSRNHYWIVAR